MGESVSRHVRTVTTLDRAATRAARAERSGALAAFANDVDEPRTLRVATGAVNEAKGADNPVNWLPPDDAAVCQYLADWVSIKAQWGLTMDESEHGRVRNLLTDRCPGQLIAPWVEVPPAATTDPVAPIPTDAANCDPSYPGVCIACAT